ncbi:hypothetical protein EDD15DRAFT_2240125, partial [Pisolithus albus]
MTAFSFTVILMMEGMIAGYRSTVFKYGASCVIAQWHYKVQKEWGRRFQEQFWRTLELLSIVVRGLEMNIQRVGYTIHRRPPPLGHRAGWSDDMAHRLER